MPPKDHVERLTDIATYAGHFALWWLYGGTEGCQQVQFAISISVWARSKHLLMCEGEWKNDSLYLELDYEVMKWETWYDITVTKSFCEKLALNVVTGRIRLSSWIHDWYKLQLPWCHLFEKKDIFQKFTAILHRHKENKYTMSFFLRLHNPLLRKVFGWLQKIYILRFNAWILKSVHFIIDTHSCWEAWLNSDDYIIIEMSDLCTYSDNPNSHTD